MIFNSSKYNSHWQDKKLSDLGSFRRGKSRHRPRNDPKLFKNGVYPLVQTGEVKQASLYLNNHHSCYNEFGLSQSEIWPKNTLCITIAANIAETALLSYPMCFPDSVVGFNAYQEESSEIFMHYVFTYIRRAIQNSASGSIQDNINVDYLTGLKFKVPLKAYQDKIVSVLSVLDYKIDLNNRINAELEAMAKTLYDYWFVQFDFPDANGKPYKTSGGKMEYNAMLKREIPAGWAVNTLSQIANITMGQSPAGESYNEDGIGTLFFQGSTDFGWLFPTPRQYTTSPARMAKKGDILLSVRAPVGDMNIANADCCIGRGLAALNSKSHSDGFLFYVMKYFKQIFDRRNAEGTTFGSMTKDDLHSLQVVCPEPGLLKRYDDIVSEYNKMIFTRSLENQDLIKLRDWLLPLLMNGQITVK
ncbi:restriction endonuclease subunit S [Salmonella enterica]|nr:restriction endonuclease subunit S [Salmonella enterica]MBA2989039.1 restriction endonuclease subunit S [Salmonella enterica subsp. arizonae serovar 47:z4,z23:-]EAZ4734425.1 restriction endonuclease subunit S [Salmonella enterica]EEC2697073.1 restriction endonuclease subunit S [Salmonella enterica]EID8005146.1 restriction endonuclease subunit S [Salmonella enterica]